MGNRTAERGTMLVVVVFMATAIAALAALSAERIVTEGKRQTVLEHESHSLVDAYAQIHFALNVVNNSAYDEDNHNVVLREAIRVPAVDPTDLPDWLLDPAGVFHGLIPGSDVRVYTGADYVQRLQALKGEEVLDVDPLGSSDGYFVLEAAGRAGDTIRLVSALVRETEPFSSFVFFQNQHTLGISGAPRGLIHTNTDLAFYFPNGQYLDAVSAVGGFEFRAGATPENTVIRDGNDTAKPISLESVDFTAMQAKSNLYVGAAGLDAEITLYRNGTAKITPYTPPSYVDVTETYTKDILIGYETKTYTVTEQVQVGTTTEERTREVIVGYTTETYTVDVPIYEMVEVEKTRQVPIYETQTTTCERWVRVFVPYETTDPAGGTTIGDSGEGILGEYQWVLETYECTQQVIVGYTTETYTEMEQVQVGTTTEERTREVAVYGTETYTVDVPVYETVEKTVTEEVPIYNTVTQTRKVKEYQPPVALGYELIQLDDVDGMIYIDGRITSLEGELNGRLTIVGNEKVRITDDIQYIDANGETAMLYGDDLTQSYTRNPDYTGTSVLGVIARDDILFTWEMPDRAEINATLMSVEGRVGIDGIWIDENGDPVKDSDSARKRLLTPEEYAIEEAYDASGDYRTRPFVHDSLRRLGGLISDERILETYIRGRMDGTAYVDAGFKRGSMRYDFNLRYNPPPNFVEIPRPAVAAFMPVFFMRNNEDR